MTLKEYLSSIDDSENIYIGSGNSFLYIGKPSEYEDEPLSTEYKTLLSENVKKAEKELREAERKLTEAKRKLTEAKLKLPSAKKDLNEFSNFGDRHVIDVYRTPAYGNLVVLIEGTENGKYWKEKEQKVDSEIKKLAVDLMNIAKEHYEKADFPDVPEAIVARKLISLLNKFAARYKSEGKERKK